MSSNTSTPSAGTPRPANAFLQAPLARLYLKTAPPVILFMTMGGLLTVIDAIFLGVFVGAEALAAVTLAFPLQMVLIALTVTLSSGLSSLLARHLGGARFPEARAVFAGAHGLALCLGLGLAILFALFGAELVRLFTGIDGAMAEMSQRYLLILFLGAPIQLLVSIHGEALRDEGRAPMMAGMSLLATLLNILLNALLIIGLGLGVAGSALGTVIAQAFALGAIAVFRLRHPTPLGVGFALGTGDWKSLLVLGLPRGVNLLGIALVSAAILLALRLLHDPAPEATLSAYGVITRIMTFCYLPMLGLAQAMQSIVGNNWGADLRDRAWGGLRLGIGLALAYGLSVEVILLTLPGSIGGLFVEDPRVAAEVARILPMTAALYALTGPLMLLASYFQAIGDAPRAALLGLAKPYLLALPLTAVMSLAFGETGLWLTTPLAEALLLVLALVVLSRPLAARRGEVRS